MVSHLHFASILPMHVVPQDPLTWCEIALPETTPLWRSVSKSVPLVPVLMPPLA